MGKPGGVCVWGVCVWEGGVPSKVRSLATERNGHSQKGALKHCCQ